MKQKIFSEGSERRGERNTVFREIVGFDRDAAESVQLSSACCRRDKLLLGVSCITADTLVVALTSQPARLSVSYKCMPLCLSAYRPAFLSISLASCLSPYPSVYLPACLTACLLDTQ